MNTIFDSTQIKAQKDWLIKAVEVHEKTIQLALMTLEDHHLMGEEYWKNLVHLG